MIGKSAAIGLATVLTLSAGSRCEPSEAAPHPLDVWYSAIDDNGLPLNPVWSYGLSGTAAGLPDAGILCDHFPNKNGVLYVQNCTSQQPVVDEPRPFHGIVPNVRYLVCSYRKEPGESLRVDSVHGHVNWGIVTYEGLLSFSDFGFPPFADGDWNWILETPGKAGYVVGNESRQQWGLVTEFNGAEVADRWTTPWWSKLRRIVMKSQRHVSAPRAAVRRLPAIVVGVLGIDTKHEEHTEVHPMYALALQVATGRDSETWEFFARNWGNEGGCSNNQHKFDTRSIAFFFPVRNGSVPIVDATRSEFRSTNADLHWGATSTQDGTVVAFELLQPSASALDYGEMRLCYGSCALPPAEGAPAESLGFPLRRDDSLAVVRHRNLGIDEPRSLVRDIEH